MGWSCTDKAAKTLQKWQDECIKQTGSQNTYRTEELRTRFFEMDRIEHEDGAITGEIMEMISETSAVPAGTFRIEPNGDVTEGPKF